eukprot:Skav233782  [mRNA]  locus=scaffold780:211267:211799:+ [translate_table: standard]
MQQSWHTGGQSWHLARTVEVRQLAPLGAANATGDAFIDVVVRGRLQLLLGNSNGGIGGIIGPLFLLCGWLLHCNTHSRLILLCFLFSSEMLNLIRAHSECCQGHQHK